MPVFIGVARLFASDDYIYGYLTAWQWLTGGVAAGVHG